MDETALSYTKDFQANRSRSCPRGHGENGTAESKRMVTHVLSGKRLASVEELRGWSKHRSYRHLRDRSAQSIPSSLAVLVPVQRQFLRGASTEGFEALYSVSNWDDWAEAI